MKLIIDPNTFPSTFDAVAGIIGDMKSRRAGTAGYCVCYADPEDLNVESKRTSSALESAVYDLTSWCRIYSDTITLFMNGNHQVAIMLTSEKE